MAYKTCWDFGGFCQETIYGETGEETISNMMAHVEESHPDKWSSLPPQAFQRMKDLIWESFSENAEAA